MQSTDMYAALDSLTMDKGFEFVGLLKDHGNPQMATITEHVRFAIETMQQFQRPHNGTKSTVSSFWKQDAIPKI